MKKSILGFLQPKEIKNYKTLNMGESDVDNDKIK